jgi:Zn-dependent protease
MKWSWKVARISGIDIYIHTTFLLLVGWLALSYWLSERSIPAVLAGLGFVLALFASVLLHELGHALAARRFGIPTRDITLLPIGGVARLERMPEKPFEELYVALAGPLVNVLIAAVLFVIWLAAGGTLPLAQLSFSEGSFIERLMVANGTLALFNLIPAFPMDGGRVVRALLASRMEYARATRLAATLGQGLALVFGFLGLFNNPMLLFIAFFVWIGAGQEANMVQVKTTLGGIPVRSAMLTDFETISPTDPLARPVELLLTGLQHDFPVVVDGKVVGLLTRENLIRGLAEYGEKHFVSYVMNKEFQVMDSAQMLDEVSQHLQGSGQRIFPVMHDNRLVGMIDLENIGEYLMVENALRARRNAQRTLSGGTRPG